MGLDCFVEKRPKVKKEEVKYWRKNWVLQNWMESENCEDKVITIKTMELLLEFIKDRDAEGSEGWTEADWEDFEKDIKDIIDDMRANETYEYTYHGWW